MNPSVLDRLVQAYNLHVNIFIIIPWFNINPNTLSQLSRMKLTMICLFILLASPAGSSAIKNFFNKIGKGIEDTYDKVDKGIENTLDMIDRGFEDTIDEMDQSYYNDKELELEVEIDPEGIHVSLT